MIEIIPSISVLQGKVVRLVKGDYQTLKVYDKGPVEFTKSLEEHGIRKVHLVDLDGARDGEPKNEAFIHLIKAYTQLEINSAGGLQTDGAVAKAFECGATSITVGAAAVTFPHFFEGWLMSYGRENVWLAADAWDGKVRIRGWQQATNVALFDLLHRNYKRGLKYAKVTDISRDGTLEGPNFDLYKQIVQEFPDLTVYSSGGVRSVDDIRQLEETGVKGVVVGKALYEGKIQLVELEQFCTADS